MLIPLWLVKGLAWATIAVVALVWLTVLLIALAWLQERLFKAACLVLAFYGSWAAYINYTRVLLHAASGGKEWFNSLIIPGSTMEPDEPISDPVPYFTIVSRPDLWRWWMRLLGAKKPEPSK